MIVLTERIQVARPAHEVFAYAGEFAHCEQWDSTACRSRKLSRGPTGKGTEYQVVCRLPLGSLTLHYRVLHWEPPNRVVLQGKCRWFTVLDTITVSGNAGDSTLDYRAEFRFSFGIERFEDRLQKGFEDMGRASIKGLQEALEDRYPAPALRTAVRCRGRCVLPGLVHFTRRGYRLRKPHFQPISAYLGHRHVVLTGATSGIGLAAARELAIGGAALTLVARDEQRGRLLIEQLQQETGNHRLALEIADLCLMEDVRALVQRLRDRGAAIDVLINNAGALFNPRQQTAEGLEKSLALLLLGPFLLTEGLLPLMQGHGDARVINVVSGGMYTQKLDMASLCGSDSPYSGSVAYAQAKRALMVQTEKWAADWQGTGVVCNAMHPGWADTPGVRQALPGFYRVMRRYLRSPEQGADTLVWLAMATEAGRVSGQLFLDREPHESYWLERTRETSRERRALAAFLHSASLQFSAGR